MLIDRPSTKVLVVDDFPTMRRFVRTLLRQMGFSNFVEADDGSEADKILKSTGDIGLIICDLNMPKMSGIELLKVVRSSSQYSNLPFLLVASESQKEQVVEAVKLGATNYIYKPFTGANLQDKLGRIFSNKNAS